MKIAYDAARELNRLPEELTQPVRGSDYPVQVSPSPTGRYAPWHIGRGLSGGVGSA